MEWKGAECSIAVENETLSRAYGSYQRDNSLLTIGLGVLSVAMILWLKFVKKQLVATAS